MGRTRFSWRGLLTLLGAVVALGALTTGPAHASPILTITPLTWNVVGLDSNSPATGPDTFPVGARVCNTGDQTATAVSTDFAFDSANAFVNLDGATTSALGDIAAATCRDSYFQVVV